LESTEPVLTLTVTGIQSIDSDSENEQNSIFSVGDHERAEMERHDVDSHGITYSVHWSFVSIAILVSLICFGAGCGAVLFGVALRRQKQTESELADSGKSNECAELKAVQSIHNVTRNTVEMEREKEEEDNLEDDEEGGIEVTRTNSCTFYSEDMYTLRETSGMKETGTGYHHHTATALIVPRPVTPFTLHSSKMFSSDPSQLSMLRRFGEHLELPVSPEPTPDAIDMDFELRAVDAVHLSM